MKHHVRVAEDSFSSGDVVPVDEGNKGLRAVRHHAQCGGRPIGLAGVVPVDEGIRVCER